MQVAQLNIAESLYPMDDPRMDKFTSRINAINALVDRADGFIWRLADENESVDGALSFRLPGDDNILVNMSVWQDIETLFAFVYKTAHAKVMTQTAETFQPLRNRHMVLWWVEDGHRPDLREAKSRLDHIQANGPTGLAFDFNMPFNAKGQPAKSNFPRKDCA